MIKGAIFDLDGTLLDSMSLWDSISSDYLIQRGIEPEPGLNRKFISLSIQQAAVYYKEHYGIIDGVDDIVNGINKMIERYYFEDVMPKEGVYDLLRFFTKEDIKMCVATATDRYMAEAALSRNGMDKYFSSIITCTEVGSGKDNPRIFEKASETLGTNLNETVVFEDALYAIKTAKMAGFKVFAVYDKYSEHNQEEIMHVADKYIFSYKDFLAHFKS